MSRLVVCYAQWFGLKTECVPPDHYTLLGLGQFESDPATIRQAARDRAMRLQPHLNGEDAASAKEILGHLKSATYCLLDAQQKAVYDQSLQANAKPAPAQSALPPRKPAAATVTSALPTGVVVATDDEPHRPTRGRAQPKANKTLVWAAVGGGAALLLVIGTVVAITMSGPSRGKQVASGDKNAGDKVSTSDSKSNSTKSASAPKSDPKPASPFADLKPLGTSDPTPAGSNAGSSTRRGDPPSGVKSGMRMPTPPRDTGDEGGSVRSPGMPRPGGPSESRSPTPTPPGDPPVPPGPGTTSAVAPPSNPPNNTNPTNTAGPTATPPASLSPADLVDKVEPAVVAIKTDTGLGSGFVIDASGLIVTNYHVISDCNSASVQFRDKTRFTVSGFVAVSPGRDLALLKISAKKPLPVLEIATQAPRKMDAVMAIGSPQGFSFTATNGTISALRTGVEVAQIVRETDHIDFNKHMKYDPTTPWIQSSAPISGGSSGGPLVNMQGKVVGVNTWTRGGDHAQNLNFAVAASAIADFVKASSSDPVKPLANLPRPKKEPSSRPSISLAGDLRVELPGGKVFSLSSFRLDRRVIATFLEFASRAGPNDAARVAETYHSNGALASILGHSNGKLDHVALVFFDNRDLQLQAMYDEGKRQGPFVYFDAMGRPLVCAQYQKNKRQGFEGFFKDGSLRLISEYDGDKLQQVHVITGRSVDRSFSSEKDARADETVKELLDAQAEVETRMAGTEKDLLKTVRDEAIAARAARTGKGPARKVDPSQRQATLEGWRRRNGM